jgi:hypothetical protein
VRSGSRSALRRPAFDLVVVLTLALGACTAPNPAFLPVAASPDAAEPFEDAAVLRPADTAPPPADAGPLADAAVAADQSLPLDAAPPEDVAASLPPDAAPPAPDLAPDLGPPGAALLVVGKTVMAALDKQLEDSLVRLGFTVTVRDAPAAVSNDASGRALVVISGSAYSDDVGSKFRDVPVPVVVFDDAIFGPMKMTGSRSGTDFGSVLGERRVLITDDTHALAGGLSGLVTVASADLQISWGVPSNAAIKVATVVDQPSRYTIFGYTEGSTMVGMTAPARRVGSFVRFPESATYTDSGLLLFEAAALWAIGRVD